MRGQLDALGTPVPVVVLRGVPVAQLALERDAAAHGERLPGDRALQSGHRRGRCWVHQLRTAAAVKYDCSVAAGASTEPASRASAYGWKLLPLRV